MESRLFLKWVVLGRNLTYLFIPFRVDLYPPFPKNFSKKIKFFMNDCFFLMNRQFLCMDDFKITAISPGPYSENGPWGIRSGMLRPKRQQNFR